MKQHLLITGAVIAALSLAALAAEEAAQAFWGITDPLAKPAFNRWTRSEDQAKQRYTREVSAASQTLREELGVVQKRLIDAGKLEEAVKVRSAIDALSQGRSPAGEASVDDASVRVRQLHGTRWRNVGTDVEWGFVLDADAMAVTAPGRHTWSGTWTILPDGTFRISAFKNNSEAMLLKPSPDGRLLTGVSHGGKEQHRFQYEGRVR